jgi:hypothetical protein
VADFSVPARLAAGAAGIAAVLTIAPGAVAQDARSEQARLADVIRLHPTDYDATYRYVLISSELRDYEAAIGALERLVAFNPRLARAQKELGVLYARLGAHETSVLHLRAALATGELDAAQTAQAEILLRDVERETEASRWSGRLQVGVRSQSNASYFPSDGLFMVGGVGVFTPFERRADFNAFELADVANETDLDGLGEARLETRFKSYATQQFHLDQYNVGLFSVTSGPRFALDAGHLPGASVRPYVTGMTSYVGGSNYLSSGGAGVAANFPLCEVFSLEPGVEYRYLAINPLGLFPSVSSLATGSAVTASVSGVYRPRDDIRLETRASFTRANAFLASQSFGQVEGQALLRFDIEPPLASIGRKWSIAPYGRIFQVAYDAADPVLVPWRPRQDVAWSAGLLVEAPINRWVGLSAAFEYSRNDSNIPNFKTDNLSVWFGPAARF